MLQCKAVRSALRRRGSCAGSWCSQAQPPPTMGISWQGRYTDSLHVVTSGVSVIFVRRSVEVHRV
ncbi:hypothetical protein CJ179_31170 [Rhodococcus sp. ACS1]|nr:hypothetical protein CJ179_31170 [Rhodococcus sp. ACS1]